MKANILLYTDNNIEYKDHSCFYSELNDNSFVNYSLDLHLSETVKEIKNNLNLKKFLNFYLKMESEHLVPQSIIDSISKDFENIYNQSQDTKYEDIKIMGGICFFIMYQLLKLLKLCILINF